MYFWNCQPETWLSYNQIPMYIGPQQFYSGSYQFIPQLQSPNLSFSEGQNSAFPHQQRVNLLEKAENQVEKPKKGQKSMNYQKSMEIIKVSRNIKSLIIKDFIRHLKKDASKIIPIKDKLNSQYPIKDFLEKLNKHIPIEKQKYIKVKLLEDLCFDHSDQEFSQMLRVLLKNFLDSDYEVIILNKKKNKAEYLKGSRELFGRIFNEKNMQRENDNID